MKRTIAVILSLLILTPYGFASFEQRPGNARSLSMSGAFTGLSDSADAVNFNSAGLALLTRAEIQGTYGKLFLGLSDGSDLSDSTLVAALPLRGKKGGKSPGTLGFGYHQMALGNNYSEQAAGLYYARNFGIVAVGCGFKYLQLGYGTDEYTGVNPLFRNGTSKSNIGIDAGALVQADESWSFGLAARNINAPDMGLKYPDPVTPIIAAGGAWKGENLNLTADIDTEGSDYKISFAAERRSIGEHFSARGGLGLGTRRFAQLTLGGGYEGENILVDYVFAYPIGSVNNSYGSHLVSFGYRFGALTQKKKLSADELYEMGIKNTLAGEFRRGYENLAEAGRLNPQDKGIQDMRDGLKRIVTYIPRAVGEDKHEKAIRSAILKYINEGDVKKSITMLLYAHSMKPDRRNVQKLAEYLAKEYKIEISESTKVWSQIEQKLFQALDRFKQKKYDECIKLCEEALNLDANNVKAFKRLGSTYYMMGNYEKAAASWKKVIDLAPSDKELPEIKRLLKEMEEGKTEQMN